MAHVVVRRDDVAAEKCDTELNEARPIGFGSVGDGADDGAGSLAQFIQNFRDAVLAGDGEIRFRYLRQADRLVPTYTLMRRGLRETSPSTASGGAE